MIITEFIKGRDVKPNAISNYIARHEEEFKDHITRNGKNTDLDPIAIELLEKKYPLVKPVMVVDGVPHEEYEALQKKCNMLLERLREAELRNANIEMNQARIEAENSAQRLLIDDKQAQIEKAENRADMERERADQAAQELAKYHKSLFGFYRKDE